MGVDERLVDVVVDKERLMLTDDVGDGDMEMLAVAVRDGDGDAVIEMVGVDDSDGDFVNEMDDVTDSDTDDERDVLLVSESVGVVVIDNDTDIDEVGDGETVAT